MENKIDVSIIIINYNTYNLVLDCIKSIIEKTNGITFEIVVVDNNSMKRDIEDLNKVFPFVRLILNNKNDGFGAGNNEGNKYASGKYLFFLNSDTLLINNAILEMFKFMEATTTAGVCGGNLFNLNLSPNISFERCKPRALVFFYNFVADFFYRKLFNQSRYFEYGNTPKKINGYISGANFFVSKEIFDKVGGFDECFFMYYEEVDLTLRINHLGLFSYVIPQAKIIHLEGGSQLPSSKMKNKWMNESRNYYFKKNKVYGFYFNKFEMKIINKLCQIKKLL